MTTKKGLKFIRGGVILILLIVGGVYIYLNRSEFAILTKLTVQDLTILTLCLLTFIICTAYTFCLLVSMLSVKLTPIEWIGLSLLTSMTNYLGPLRPGVVVKAAYLKHQKSLSYSRFSSILAANGFLLFFYSGTTGLLLLSLVWLVEGIISFLLTAICVALIIGSMVPFAVKFSQFKYQGRIWNVINDALEGFDEIRTQRSKILLVGSTVIAQYLISALCHMIAYQAMGLNLSFLSALLIGVFASIANFFTITPNNIGIQEIVIAYLLTITGINFADGLVGAVLIRVLLIALIFGLTPIFTFFLLKSANLSLSTILPGQSQPSGDLVVPHGERQH